VSFAGFGVLKDPAGEGSGLSVFWKSGKISLSTVILLVGPMRTNVWALGEEADFEAQNFLPAQNLIRSTKLHLSTEPAFLLNAC
jgi:hypothetical protein